MFTGADNLLRHKAADRAVCLIDIPDDWDIALYAQTFDEAIRFAKRYPETRRCYGNHDLCYQWYKLESGFSSMASVTVQKKLLELRTSVSKEIRFVMCISDLASPSIWLYADVQVGKSSAGCGAHAGENN